MKIEGSGTFEKEQATAGKPTAARCLVWENSFLSKTTPSTIVREAEVSS